MVGGDPKSLEIELRILQAQREAEQAAYSRALAAKDGELAHHRQLLRALEQKVAELQAALATTHASASWRVTAPLRGFVHRNPALSRGLHAVAARFPGAGRHGLWAARNAWRLVTLRPMAALTPMPSVETTLPVVPPPSLEQAPGKPILWFHIGDTLDWLADHEHLTGVGRVTTKILAAAVADDAPWYLSVLQDGVLSRLTDQAPGGHLAAAEALQEITRKARVAARQPAPGDHVIFTGVVWTPAYVALFDRLRAQRIRFSILLYDLIPLQRPDLVSRAHGASFVQFLSTIANEAEVIFTSADNVRAQLARWLLAEGTITRNPVEVISFGPSLPYASSPTVSPVVAPPFTLCVGTIDQRKNQLLLCKTWARLAAERDMPTLVLVGRDDIGLHSADPDVAALVASGVIRVLTDVQDPALDALYRAAAFTLFPSFSEGYGLPVGDSLAYGKLCLASNLPVIREWAGDLPWYFPPHDSDALSVLVRRALDDAAAVSATEARIAAWKPTPWVETSRAIGNAVLRHMGVDAAKEPRPDRPFSLAPGAFVLARTERWCVADQPDVSIIIVNFRATGATLACIRDVWAQTTGVTYEVLIADNGSSQEQLATLGRLGDGVRLLPLGVNRYSGEANNIAAEAARGRLVCFLKNDVIVSEDWLTMLSDRLRDPAVGVVGPVIRASEPDGARGADRRVDYVSAACLLMRRELFVRAGGFDLVYEPAGFEDADLCLKIAALGYTCLLAGAVEFLLREGGPNTDDASQSARKQTIEDLNRHKFLSRWQDYLQTHDQASLEAIGTELLPPVMDRDIGAAGFRRVLVYSHYALTPGGGERYVLTLAAVLARHSAVTIMTPHAYSHIRLLQLGREFGIDLSTCAITPLAETAGEWDVLITMGNHVMPPIAARARRNLFICQFPFPLLPEMTIEPLLLAGYDTILAYSDFVKRNIEAAMARHDLLPPPIRVLHPPVPQFAASNAPKKTMILTVGRFYTGGHNKRHDLLIEAFRTLHDRFEGSIELHLAGSSIPDARQIDYLARLRAMAASLPVVFHVNATSQALEQLYREAAIYWHGTGLEVDLKAHPEKAEHFGIAIVEAMGAGCTAFALDAGGAPEIITNEVDGFLYETRAMLVERTLAILDDPTRRALVGMRARDRAADFALPAFVGGVESIFKEASAPAELVMSDPDRVPVPLEPLPCQPHAVLDLHPGHESQAL